MKLNHDIHLAYCTNIHRGESWSETFAALEKYTLRVKERVCPSAPYAVGLRLSDEASRELSDRQRLIDFQRWLEKENCYVFTINGFPYGKFHGTRVKEQVYLPDWTSAERVAYTKRLFEILAQIVPANVEGSVSTVPCSFKAFIKTQEQVREMRDNLWSCVEQIEKISARTGKMLHLGLEPEPLCYLETSQEAVSFINRMREDRAGDERLNRFLGVNYDTCHLAVEYEQPEAAIERFERNEIKISKLHFSSALKVIPTRENKKQLESFIEPVYFHQVIARNKDGTFSRYTDLEEALKDATPSSESAAEEWRIHFHIPLHCAPGEPFQSTQDHLVGVMDLLAKKPKLCSHIEMETYTWEVLPPELKKRDVVDQLAAEYDWTLSRLRERGLAPDARG
jgi:hypothetical protein